MGASLVQVAAHRGFYCPAIAGLVAGLGVRFFGARLSYDLIVLAGFFSLAGMLAADFAIFCPVRGADLMTCLDRLNRTFTTFKCVQYGIGMLLGCMTVCRTSE